MALITIGLSTFILLSGFMNSFMINTENTSKKIDNNELNESLNNIKIVKSLNGEKTL